MLFVKTEDLRQGMRLAKPIYNKKGVLLYGRDTKLTDQGIQSIKNFGLIGIYVLEPAEPLPPMSDDDIEFERFQTMAVFSIKDDLETIINRREPKNLSKMADLILTTYGRSGKKINFQQNLRSPEDYVYKHSLNVAILSALIAKKLRVAASTMKDIVMVALVHDVGMLLIDEKLSCMDDPEPDDRDVINKAIMDGYNLLDYANVAASIKRLAAGVDRELYGIGSNFYEGKDKKLNIETKILMVADRYDKITAMKLNVEPSSEFVAIKELMKDKELDQKVVAALMNAINILTPGVCVELNSGEKGLVIRENKSDVLAPIVLGFNSNMVYNLELVDDSLQIKDIMKSMDNRTIIDKSLLEEYL